MFFKRPVLMVEYLEDDDLKEFLLVFSSAEEVYAKRKVSERSHLIYSKLYMYQIELVGRATSNDNPQPAGS